MKVTTLIENTTTPGLDDFVAEHGLSLLIEHAGQQILFDTGQTGQFADNAERLGIDLRRVDWAVISHHHYDHGGGLERFLAINSTAPIYLRPHPDGLCISKHFSHKKYIGLDDAFLKAHADRFVYLENNQAIGQDAFVLTSFGRTHALPPSNRALYLQRDEEIVPDTFTHELVLVLREADGLCVFTGCGHQGVLNMLEAVQKSWPGEPIKAVIGGFHMMATPPLDQMSGTSEEVCAVGARLMQVCQGRVFTGHCTGAHAFDVLKGVMGQKLDALSTGSSFSI